ncbi:MAG: serine/threonine protein kinase [Planctomycetes bacterium]|nr:serine/threonine protein kinase [Planctomycetota bacterium]
MTDDRDRTRAADDGSATPLPGEQAGDRIDRYTLLGPIGEGGMGSVWLAEQHEPVARRVALKVIKFGMDTREVVRRFETERQALALMDHPNIAKVLDGGATAAGRPFFVMELVEGEPITDYCDRRQLELRDRLLLFSQVCDAIQHAHHKGLIHRDIKPSNVLVSERDGTAVPKVIDFGIAKATGTEIAQQTMLTQHDQLIGTPEYMSPEQAGMTDEDIDTRADVYSLGALLYELLTGTKPFDMREIVQHGYLELLRRIREVDPEKPSTRVASQAVSRGSATRLATRLRGDLDWIVMKSLEKDRRRRYATASEFANDIGRYLADEAVVTVPPSALYRLHKFMRRRRKTVAVAAAISFLLIVGSIGTGIGWYETGAANRALSQALDELRQVAAFQSEQLGDLDVNLMGARMRTSLLDAAEPGQRDAVERSIAGINFTNLAMQALEHNVFDRTLAAIDRQFGERSLVRARLLTSTAETLNQLGLTGRAEEPQARAIAILREQLGDEHPDTLAALSSRAVMLHELDRFGEAEQLHRTVWQLRAERLGPDDPLTLTSFNNIGRALMRQGKIDEAEPYLRGALEQKRKLLGERDPSTIAALNAVSQLDKMRGDYAAAETAARQVHEAYLDRYGGDDVRTYTARKLIGEMLWRQRKFAAAEPHFRAAYEGTRKALGDDHPDTLAALNDLGNLMIDLKRFEEAETLMREVVDRKRRAMGARHSSTMISLNNLALLLQDLKRFDEALPLLQETRDICLEIVGERHEHTLTASGNLARLLLALGRREESVAMMQENCRIGASLYGADHPNLAIQNFNLAATLRDLRRFDASAERFSEVVAQQRGAPADQRFLLGQALGGLGFCRIELGEFADAETVLRESIELQKQADNAELYVPMLTCALATAIAKQHRFAEAEPLLVDAGERLVQVPTAGGKADSITAALQRVVDFYRDWHTADPAGGHDAEATAWQQRLQERPTK